MPKKTDYCPKNRVKPSRVKKHWAVPASWLAEQATLHLKGSDHNVIFASDGKELWIYGYKPAPPKGKAAGRGDMTQHPMAWSFPGPALMWGGGGDEAEKTWFEDWPEPKPGGGG